MVDDYVYHQYMEESAIRIAELERERDELVSEKEMRKDTIEMLRDELDLLKSQNAEKIAATEDMQKDLEQSLKETELESELARIQRELYLEMNNTAGVFLNGCDEMLTELETKILQYRMEAERIMLSINRGVNEERNNNRFKLSWNVIAAGSIGALVAAAAVVYAYYQRHVADEPENSNGTSRS